MVIRKKGSVFFIDGKEFKIGGGVFANDESEYMGLYGTVTEIRTDEDRETENDTPDIYCEFMSPDSVAMAAELVTRFSDLYRQDTQLQDTLWLEQFAVSPGSIPELTQIPEGRYALPAQPMEVQTFKGELFNQKELEQQLRKSNSFTQMMSRSELDNGVKRPLLPLSISQIGLIGGSGMINGLIECDTPHIIKGRIVKVVRTESEEKFSARGKHMGSEVTETISNKMIFNVLTPNGFKALT